MCAQCVHCVWEGGIGKKRRGMGKSGTCYVFLCVRGGEDGGESEHLYVLVFQGGGNIYQEINICFCVFILVGEGEGKRE